MVIYLACNDPDNGMPANKLWGIKFGDLAEFESMFLDAPICTCDVEHQRVRLGRKTFAIQAWRAWAGNWCWDAITVTPQVATAILKHLRSLKYHGDPKIDLTSGDSKFWDLYKAGKTIRFLAPKKTQAEAKHEQVPAN